MRKTESVIKEYVSKLPFDSLKYLSELFDRRIGPDLSDAIEFLSRNPEIDKFLGAARSYEEFWNAVDLVSSFIEKEFARRTPELVTHA